MTDQWQVLDLINVTKSFFEKKGIRDQGTQRLDAELLLAKVLGCRRIDLYLRFEETVDEPELSEFRHLVRQRGERRPVKQILGRCEFMAHEFQVTPDVLIPRPETETVVECALAEIDDSTRVVIDVGTGCGNIAISIALAKPRATVYATDISGAAVEVAGQNTENLGVSERVTIRAGDLFEPLAGDGLVGAADCVVSNPPYVAESEFASLMPEVAQHEPTVALVSGQDGMSHTLRLLAEAPDYLRPAGVLVIETSPNTAGRDVAAAHANDAYEDIRIRRDLGRAERVLMARKKKQGSGRNL